MFWFLRLWLAHLIADFPLQTNLIFRLKKKSIFGVFIHGTVFLILALFLSIPYLKYFISWIYIILVWLFHIWIDWEKIKVSNTSKERDNVWYFVLDQILHLISLIFVFFIPISRYPQLWENPNLGKIWIRFYNSDYFILLSIGYILVVFAGTVFTFYVRKSFSGKEEFIKLGIPTKEKYSEGFFKSILFLIFWFNIKNLYIILLIILFIKFLSDKYILKLSYKSYFLNTMVDIVILTIVISLLKLLL